MGVKKIQIQHMIREVEKKQADKIKIRRLRIRKDSILADLTFTKDEQQTLVTRVYKKDLLCAQYAQSTRSQ